MKKQEYKEAFNIWANTQPITIEQGAIELGIKTKKRIQHLVFLRYIFWAEIKKRHSISLAQWEKLLKLGWNKN